MTDISAIGPKELTASVNRALVCCLGDLPSFIVPGCTDMVYFVRGLVSEIPWSRVRVMVFAHF